MVPDSKLDAVDPFQIQLTPMISRPATEGEANAVRAGHANSSHLLTTFDPSTLPRASQVTVSIALTWTAQDQMDQWGVVFNDTSLTKQRHIITAALNGLVADVGCTVQCGQPNRGVEIAVLASDVTGSAFSVFLGTSVTIVPPNLPTLGLHDTFSSGSPALRNTPEPPLALLPGLEQAHASLRDMLLAPLRYPQLFTHMNIDCPKGVLLHGPPGVGKTWLVSQVARECQATLRVVQGPDIIGAYLGESEANLRRVFQAAQESIQQHPDQPCVLFIDEIDAIAPSRADTQAHTARVIGQLLTLMDGLESRGRLVIIAATNRPNALDPALRRPGRFDREVAVDVPNATTRQSILQFHTRALPLASGLDLAYLASITHGYVGADLAALCREAAKVLIMRQAHPTGPSSMEAIPALTLYDFQRAMRQVGPSLQRGLALDITPVTWDDVGGLAEVKVKLKQAVEWPQQYPDTFARLGLMPPTGILLYGPPGCSKTTLARVIANQMQSSFFSLSGAALYSPLVGDSERILRDLFRRARASAPSVIFFDEIDAMVGKRQLTSQQQGSAGAQGNGSVQERILTMLLNEMDGVESARSVLVVGATNRPDMLDAALLRPGRFDRLVYVPPPDATARCQILQIHTRATPLASSVDLTNLAQRTDRFSGADLANLCREAALICLRAHRVPAPVESAHFDQALAVVQPSISQASLTWYQRFGQNQAKQSLAR
ncbi:hypothetical protein H4R34_001509 [Dimargaris verticillata]|uniref:AAA+ ATPase domain-containing protein n=1 Tax=Dimargaris verticillata TaxID=2761393 RepID=A0A9W8B9S9_9FUNG|nr:hypothetical protein H4R34_001509 [Dimargaris verticillata]